MFSRSLYQYLKVSFLGLSFKISSFLLIICSFSACSVSGPTKSSPVFSSFGRFQVEAAQSVPRGGTTVGPKVELLKTPRVVFPPDESEKLSKFEKDRLAILSMEGEHKTTFEFQEVFGFAPDYQLDRPYQSWATEKVFLIEDQSDFISLQHVLVMSFIEPNGEVSGPFVLKHWRQDWHYQEPSLFEYVGNDTWEVRRVSESLVAGSWTQKVYHVDDSPRYSSYGKWQHHHGLSEWRGSRTGRPIPRRESSVRSDYEVLLGENTVSITPTGWVHEQSNLKLLDRAGNSISKEIGLNKYLLLEGEDFLEAFEYWKKTSSYWATVRETWREFLSEKDGRFKLVGGTNGKFSKHFEDAEKFSSGNRARELARANVLSHIE